VLTAGILVASVINAFLVPVDGGWRWAIACQAVAASVLLALMPCLPRSPRWLVKQGCLDEALQSLRAVRDEDEAHIELAEIVAEHHLCKDRPEPMWRELCQGRMRKLVLIGASLQMLAQLTGMNAFMYFGPRIFERLHLDVHQLQTAMTLVNFLSTFPALHLADRCGRTQLLQWSATGMTLACVGMGSLGHFYEDQDGGASQMLAFGIVTMIFMFVANFAYGWGPMVWVYNSEIFPLRHRSRAMAVATCSSWMGNFIIGQSTPILLGLFGFKTFYIFGMFCFTALLLASWLPETKGVLLEHMVKVFDEKLGEEPDPFLLSAKVPPESYGT